jgi:hypothetical protein
MKRTIVIGVLALAMAAGFPATDAGARRHEPVARVSARSIQMPTPARMQFQRVDIEIFEWSTDLDHRSLGRTVAERGPAGFSALLAGYPALGWIGIGDREFTVRYAWQATDRDGGGVSTSPATNRSC